ncbi:MAG: DUF1569 domain-containing protein [Mariniblastus sp.]|nr:DUF1569 domain-containing protein [Mariniblastus sp.]
MSKPKPQKRKLKFSDYDEMMVEVQALAESGYVSNGNWNLGQASSHVADWMLFPLDGFPVPPLPIRIMFWFMKKTVVPGMKRKILAEGFKGGVMTAPETVAGSDEYSDQQGQEKLRAAVDRVSSHTGSLYPSPLFGEMDMAMHHKVSLLHAEHHFGYLQPKLG